MYLRKTRDKMTSINPRRPIWATLLSYFERRNARWARQNGPYCIWGYKVEVMCFVAQKSCKRCWTSFTLSTCKTDRKYGYKLLKIICNLNEFTDFERRTEKCRIALRLLPFNNKTKWDGLMTAHFELGKCRKM